MAALSPGQHSKAIRVVSLLGSAVPVFVCVCVSATSVLVVGHATTVQIVIYVTNFYVPLAEIY